MGPSALFSQTECSQGMAADRVSRPSIGLEQDFQSIAMSSPARSSGRTRLRIKTIAPHCALSARVLQKISSLSAFRKSVATACTPLALATFAVLTDVSTRQDNAHDAASATKTETAAMAHGCGCRGGKCRLSHRSARSPRIAGGITSVRGTQRNQTAISIASHPALAWPPLQ